MLPVGAPRPLTPRPAAPAPTAKAAPAPAPAAKPAPAIAPRPVKPIQAQGAPHPAVKAGAVALGAAGGLAAGGVLGAVGCTLVGGILGLGEAYLALGMVCMAGWAVVGAVAAGWGVYKLLSK